jgi:hypothetical protein
MDEQMPVLRMALLENKAKPLHFRATSLLCHA